MKITLADEIILYRHVKYKGITLNIFELGKKYMKGLRVDPLQFLLDTFSASWRRWNAKSTCQNLIRSSWNILSPARLYCSKTAQQAASGSFLTRDAVEQPAGVWAREEKWAWQGACLPFFAGPHRGKDLYVFDSLAQVEREREKARKKVRPSRLNWPRFIHFPLPECVFFLRDAAAGFPSRADRKRWDFHSHSSYFMRRAELRWWK